MTYFGLARGYLRAMVDASPRASQFLVLSRTFFAQFFASESVTSEHQLRQAMIGVVAFLIALGFFIPLQLYPVFELAAVRFPELLEPLTRMMATIFIALSMVSIGLAAALVWDSLSLDRRDAMVLGPLPLSGTTVIAAKLTAMALLLMMAALAINAVTAVPFAMIASGHKAVVSVGRHLIAHVVATTAAATFVFCGLVTLRALLGMVSGGRIAVASLVQFTLVTALLCFIAFVPTALTIGPGARVGGRVGFVVHQQPIPSWSPTNWFVGLYEVARGTSQEEHGRPALTAVAFTLGTIVSAIVTTCFGYRRQLQLALTPAAATVTFGPARIQRALARRLVGQDQIARATSDFLLITIARNRAQHVPVAINAAVGLALVMAGLSRGAHDLPSLMRVRTAILWIPLVLGYGIAIGVRASFYVPSELPASWTFRFHAPEHARASWSAVRAATMALVVPPTLLVTGLLLPLIGWRVAGWHALVACALMMLLAEVVALTIDFVPFTREHRPGHAKLKTRWPLYLLGLYVFAYWPARLELWMLGQHVALLDMVAWIALGIVGVEALGRRQSARRPLEFPDEQGDKSELAVLDLSFRVRRTSES